MRIALYSPYFPKHTGGGEKYFLDTAEVLAHYGEVSLAVPGESLSKTETATIYKKYARFMGHEIRHLQLVPSPLGTPASAWQKMAWTRSFDLMYAFTDGSFFLNRARRGVLHIQTPLLRGALTLPERIKLASWQFVNTNSGFTRQVVEGNWRLSVNAVHSPLVDVWPLERLAARIRKQKVILHVGRFFSHLHTKRQDVLVSFFKNLCKRFPKEAKGWQLVLIGSVEDEQYAARVRSLAKGAPIRIIHSVTRQTLNLWYAKASIYWHATGFGLSPEQEPASMEHFGISTAEAMAAGAVPVVIGQGGQPEVVGEQLRELLWTDEKSCLEKTARLMNNKTVLQAFSRQAQLQSQRFSPQAFEAHIRSMLVSLGLL